MKKVLAILLALICAPAAAQNYLRDDGIFHSVVEGTTTNQILVNTGDLLTGLSSANNSIMVTNGSGVPSWSTTLPAGILVPGYALLAGGNTFTGSQVFNVSGGTLNRSFEVITDDAAASTASYAAINYAGVGAGITTGGQFHGGCVGGSVAVPTPCKATWLITGVGGVVYTGSAWSISSPASMHYIAAEDQTPTANGAYINWYRTLIGTALLNRVNTMTLTQDGTLWIKDATSTFNPLDTKQTKPGADVQLLSSGVSSSIGNALYGTSITGGFKGFKAGGTPASPTGTPAGDQLAFIGGYGYNGTSGAWILGASTFLDMRSAEPSAYSSTLQGAYAAISVTPAGSTIASRIEHTRFVDDGTLGIGTTAKLGAGTVNVLTNYYINGTLLKNVSETLTNKTISGASNTLSNIGNASLTNSSTTVNGQTCTLGSSCTVTATATGVTVGTTTVTSGTSNGVLTNNAGVLANTAAGTNGQLFLGVTSGQPVFATMSSDATITNAGVLTIANNAVTLAKLATQATNTVLANATSGTAVPTALSVSSCDTATKALQWTTNTGFACNSSINAATLGGATFSAPGAIGGGTPSTGAFTTLSASTSLTTPLHIGGSGTTGTQLTFQTTTGNGTTDAFSWKRGNNGATTAMTLNNTGLGVGSVATDAALSINSNAATTGSAFSGSTALHIVAPDSTTSRFVMDAAQAITFITARTTGGTIASPSATTADQAILGFGVSGYTDSIQTGSFGFFRFHAKTLWSASNADTYLVVHTTPTGSLTPAEAWRTHSSGGFSVGTTTDPGIGSILATGTIRFNTALSANGSAGVTRTCTIAVGNVLTFTLGILTATSGAAGCV